jgi:hypothetical protein
MVLLIGIGVAACSVPKILLISDDSMSIQVSKMGLDFVFPHVFEPGTYSYQYLANFLIL